jgi:uncharacterized BrkB/YihY/UPF0761 family membrane protein
LWLYYSAQIFLYGAELTRIRAEAGTESVEPASYARVDEPKRTESAGALGQPTAQLDKPVASRG